MNELKLSNIKKVNPEKLKENEFNKHFFKVETGNYFDRLTIDIKKNGIIVPLIAKKNNVLLAGHNRLLIAKNLNLKIIPVQYLENELSEKKEKEFMIKDNLLRRHLSYSERIELYRFLIKDFDKKVQIKNSKEMGLNQNEIANMTGLNPKTIGYDLSKVRGQKNKEQRQKMEIDPVNEKAIEQYKKATSKMLNTAIIDKGKTLQLFIEITESVLKNLIGIK